jgi:tRNA(fMet)-specific endonuclease VapC
VIYLLDTNAWIAYLRQKNQRLVQRFQQTSSSDIVLCSVVLAELIYGAHHSPAKNQAANLALVRRLQKRFVSMSFDDGAADEYGKIRAYLASQGMPIGPNDLMIASIALANDLTIVTHNTSEFSRVPGVKLQDWQ